MHTGMEYSKDTPSYMRSHILSSSCTTEEREGKTHEFSSLPFQTVDETLNIPNHPNTTHSSSPSSLYCNSTHSKLPVSRTGTMNINGLGRSSNTSLPPAVSIYQSLQPSSGTNGPEYSSGWPLNQTQAKPLSGYGYLNEKEMYRQDDITSSTSLGQPLRPSQLLIAEPRLSSTKPMPSSGTSQNSNSVDHWVTVFGFPASHTSIILACFQNCGQILKIRHPENQGNWVHILYQTRLQAEKALGKNGKILDCGNIMIGVSHCTDKNVLAEQISNLTEMTHRLPLKEGSPYISSVPEYAVQPVVTNPTPKSSYWSRFMELVIGY